MHFEDSDFSKTLNYNKIVSKFASYSYFDKDDSILIAASIVSYRDSSFMNANIEKQLAKIPLKKAHSLGEAINWV